MAAYHLKQSDSAGRYTVAGRLLAAGEVVLSEPPFAVGPKNYSPLLCLGCYAPLYSFNACHKCSWPTCSPECSENIWHKEYECAVFSKCGVKFQEGGSRRSKDEVVGLDNCLETVAALGSFARIDIMMSGLGDEDAAQLSGICPLRVLLASEREPARWAEVAGMEAHSAARRDQPDWNAEQVNVVHFLRDKCKLDRFSAELIEKVCGILEVNCYEVISRSSTPIRGLYPKSALLNHNCVVNTAHSIDPSDDYRLVLRTTVEVGEGKELFASYTSCLHPTPVRRARLRQHKYFSCTCQRCTDPTELGTHIGTLKCTKCDNGIITSTNPLDDEANWKCSHCENGVTSNGVRRIYDIIQTELDELEEMEMGSERLEATEKALRKYKSVLHPHNGFNAMLWHSLSQMYGHCDGYTLDMMPDILLERKSKFCKDLLDLLNVIEPGYTRMRGLILYEYHVSLLMVAQGQFQRGAITSERLRQIGNEVLAILQESATILSLEPQSSPEAVLANIARQSIQQLETSLQKL